MPRLTNVTLADLGGQYISRDNATGAHGARQLFWDAQHDLAEELAERQPHLTFEQHSHLLQAATSGNPVVLTWETRLGGRYDRQSIETTTTTVVVEYVAPTAEDDELRDAVPGMVRIHHWGFGHAIYMTQIVDVAIPETTRSYRDAA